MSEPTLPVSKPSPGQRFARWWSDDAVPATPRGRARQRAIRRAVISSGLLVLAGSLVRLPLLVVSPGPVFNTIGAIANSFWLFIPIFIIGHGLNFALNLLGCYVHDLRLQCLEYFGKFYEDGGRPFDPLTVKTKYYNVAE